MNFKRLNTLAGWGVFAIAMFTYLSTMAPTASFWDCGEFIACANELQVPHPPGAPFFLLLGRVFAMFAGSPERIAWMLNLTSALASGFTVLFTFWITTMLAKNIMVGASKANFTASEPTMTQAIAILLAGAGAALTLTFSDSFWFNAVEAEVYAMSSFFTAIVVWLMLKWEERADEIGNERWIILIAYVMGVSIGVHLLNLLTIPALAYVYYFRKHTFSWFSFLITGAISIVILAVVQYGIILQTFDMAWRFEKLLVGTIGVDGSESGFGLPIGTGLFLFLLIVLGALIWGIYYSHKKKMLWLNTALVSAAVIYIGFSSYAVVPIRSNANPPIDENNPENTLSFVSYMKREQYGNRPLLRGALYNAQAIGYDEEPEYLLQDGAARYTEAGIKREPKYNEADMVFFPRMYDVSRYDERYPTYPFSYLKFVRSKGEAKQDGSDVSPYDDHPTKAEDSKFFWKYQFMHMYWRYFLWNFAGRESDVQDANWESGLNFSKTASMPDVIKNDPTKNHYYALPLILGLLGLSWQVKKRGTDAAVIGMLFFFTGVAIIIYLNQPPAQPRERDYSFVGSFQTFAIWIGLGVLALYEFLNRYIKSASLAVAAVATIGVPSLLASQNWFDHSRANNYLTPDSAYNLLNSLAPNAVLFTNGDNDTFPLWYIQEVEGVRRDVRVLCLSYVNTDWYIDQMYRKMNDSEPLPLTIPKSQYQGQENQAKFVGSRRTVSISLPVDKQALISNSLISEAELPYADSAMIWDVKTRGGGDQRYLELKDVLILNLLENTAKQGWKRPIYFANTVAPNAYLELEPYFRSEGLAYRVLPVKYPDAYAPQDPFRDPYPGAMMADATAKMLSETFRYRGLTDASIYYDENARHMVNNYHLVTYRLVSYYLGQAEKYKDNAAVAAENREKAMKFAKLIGEKFPYTVAPPEFYVIARDAMLFDRLGMEKETNDALNFVRKQVSETITYYAKTKDYYGKTEYDLAALGEVVRYYAIKGDRAKQEEWNKLLQDLAAKMGMS